MSTRLRGKDFISLKDYSREELETILEVAFDLKRKLARREPHQYLLGKNLGMLFANTSTRTRISFETGMSHLGGHAQYYAPDQLQIVGSGETLMDTAKVMSSYLDGFLIRLIRDVPNIPQLNNLKYGEAHNILKTMAGYADIPLINAGDDKEHPCQTMADIMTIMEKFGPDYRKKKLAMVWVSRRMGVSPGVAQSFAVAGGALGMRITFYNPEGFDLDDEYIGYGRQIAEQNGGSIETVHDIKEATKDADIIYAKSWKAITKTKEEDLKLRQPLMDYRVREENFANAAPGALFMNCMPIERGLEADADVVDGPRSLIYDEAENRLHIQKAIMSLIM